MTADLLHDLIATLAAGDRSLADAVAALTPEELAAALADDPGDEEDGDDEGDEDDIPDEDLATFAGRKDGETWVTNGRAYTRAGGKTTWKSTKQKKEPTPKAKGGTPAPSSGGPAPVATPEKPPAARKTGRAKSDSLLAVVRTYGGLDPQSAAFLAHYSGVNEAIQNGINLGIFKRGGRSLDQLAQELHTVGHIQVPDGVEPTQHLIEQLAAGAKTRHADLVEKHADAEAEYYRVLQEAEDHARANPGTRSDIEEAIRRGEAAGEAEASADPFGDGGEADGDDFRRRPAGREGYAPSDEPLPD